MSPIMAKNCWIPENLQILKKILNYPNISLLLLTAATQTFRIRCICTFRVCGAVWIYRQNGLSLRVMQRKKRYFLISIKVFKIDKSNQIQSKKIYLGLRLSIFPSNVVEDKK